MVYISLSNPEDAVLQIITDSGGEVFVQEPKESLVTVKVPRDWVLDFAWEDLNGLEEDRLSFIRMFSVSERNIFNVFPLLLIPLRNGKGIPVLILEWQNNVGFSFVKAVTMWE